MAYAFIFPLPVAVRRRQTDGDYPCTMNPPTGRQPASQKTSSFVDKLTASDQGVRMAPKHLS
jgi:hypothetical protein